MKRYYIKRCGICGGQGELYATGLAEQIYEDGEWYTQLIDTDGYAVRCTECYNETQIMRGLPEKAVSFWNQNCGDKEEEESKDSIIGTPFEAWLDIVVGGG